jgi:hypothetical protein
MHGKFYKRGVGIFKVFDFHLIILLKRETFCQKRRCARSRRL